MRGGARKGAGRKKAQHTIATEAMRAFVVETVRKNLEPLVSAQLDLALGHKVQGTDADGEVCIYTKSPDGKAIEYLLNQSIGKPKEQFEHSGKDGAAIPMSIDLKNASEHELLKFLTAAGEHTIRVHGES